MLSKTNLIFGMLVMPLFTVQLWADSYSVPSGLKPNQPFVIPNGPTEGGVSVFTNEASFIAAVSTLPKSLKFLETFEEATTPASAVGSVFPPPLAPGVPAGDFPNGLAATNIRLNCADTSGDGACDLITLGAGFLPGLGSTVLGPNTFGDSLVIETLPGAGKTAIGFEVDDPGTGTPDYDVTVADTSGNVLFSGTLIGVGATDGFIGVLSNAPIGSISVNGVGGGGELIDNIQLYTVPEPTSASLLLVLMGIIGVVRRRS